MLAAGAAWGPIPVAEAIRRCEELIAEAGDTAHRGGSWVARPGVLTAMEGRFDDARRMAARGRAILGDVGFKILSAAYSQSSAYVEMLAGEPRQAERELRSGYADLEQMGEKGYLSTVAAELAQALYEQRRYDEAERFTHVSEELGPVDDIATQVEWRGTRAKVLARRGDHDASRRARGRGGGPGLGHGLPEPARGRPARISPRCCPLAGRLDEAASRSREALEIYERKGNVVSADGSGRCWRTSRPTRPSGDTTRRSERRTCRDGQG